MSTSQPINRAEPLGPVGAFYVAFWQVAKRPERGGTYGGPAGLWRAVCFLRTIAVSGHLVTGTLARVNLERAETGGPLFDHAAGVDTLPLCPVCQGPWCGDWAGHYNSVQKVSRLA